MKITVTLVGPNSQPTKECYEFRLGLAKPIGFEGKAIAEESSRY